LRIDITIIPQSHPRYQIIQNPQSKKGKKDWERPTSLEHGAWTEAKDCLPQHHQPRIMGN
jgi:hypothetical protein